VDVILESLAFQYKFQKYGSAMLSSVKRFGMYAGFDNVVSLLGEQVMKTKMKLLLLTLAMVMLPITAQDASAVTKNPYLMYNGNNTQMEVLWQ
jgi:hypothetical protein